jgi:hypothetical protein
MPFDPLGFVPTPTPCDPTTEFELQLLMKARTFIAKPTQWCKHQMGSWRTGRVCMVGAVMRACGVPIARLGLEFETGPYCPGAPKAAKRLRNILADYVPECHAKSVEGFNDANNTRHADVLAVFDAAIAAFAAKLVGLDS